MAMTKSSGPDLELVERRLQQAAVADSLKASGALDGLFALITPANR
jgi:hypothetical protein